MALSLKSITTNGTARKGTVASSHVDRIGSVTEMISTGMRTILVVANVVTRRSRKTETTGSKGLGESLKGNSGKTEGKAKKRSDDTTK